MIFYLFSKKQWLSYNEILIFFLFFRARLSRLALNQESSLLYKYSLRCVENSLSLLPPSQDLQSLLPSRLRWYSLAEYLYSETLLRMMNNETQEQKSQEKLLFYALKHAVESANKVFIILTYYIYYIWISLPVSFIYIL